MGSLWTTYQIQTGLAQGLMFGFGVTYKGDSFADTLNLLRVPSYVVYDADGFVSDKEAGSCGQRQKSHG